MNTTFDFAFSAQGYNHIKSDKVCQDASASYSDDLMTIAVVADGHGSDNYPRTDRGSRFAVEATVAAIKEFVNTVESSAIDITVEAEPYLEQLSKNILASWHAAVDGDLDKCPFYEEELSKVSDKYKKRYLSGEKTEKAYGTTLIAACQTPNYWFGLQIGDGKCVCISKDGSMFEPIPWDEDCQANITTSICDSEAIDEFRYCLLKESPVATLMGTDGIDDSYANDEELYVLYRSILTIFAEHGRETVETEIQEFLPKLSRKGSGDDVSIAGIISSNLSNAFINVLKAQCEYLNAKSQREKADREVVLVAEKQEYVLTAMSKAKTNYDLCVQKAAEVKAEIDNAQRIQEEALKRYEAAEIALAMAIEVYNQNDMPVSEAELMFAPSINNESIIEAVSDGQFSVDSADAKEDIPVGNSQEVSKDTINDNSST